MPDNNTVFSKVMLIVNIFMVCIYIGGAAFIIWSDYFSYIPKTMRVIFGSLLFLYGIFRFVRLFSKMKSDSLLYGNQDGDE